ncbi:hypothetical protein DD238_006946 [Peronospora effusa]|uniref:Uncharacterized protein n=1 Tax=Peronospora effusa TaxID=542832 RepID=A0A3M6VIT9_9STRA|nr:hypothetical protein DD238_006946 [Peronospora effusa]RQM09360.1 hypothetical protein DD237_005982 [Peronospora effusa]
MPGELRDVVRQRVILLSRILCSRRLQNSVDVTLMKEKEKLFKTLECLERNESAEHALEATSNNGKFKSKTLQQRRE